MSDAKPKTVKVKALQLHTYNGQTYQVGDVYDIDEQFAESVKVQGKAVRVEDAPAQTTAKPARTEAQELHKSAQRVPDKSTASASSSGTTVVEPMKWEPK